MSDENERHREAEGRDEAEEMARLQEQINNLPVSEHIVFMMHSLSSLAVDRLGLAPEGGARLDVSQARLAIDAFKALLGVLEEATSAEAIAAHRGVLSQLQLAYVGALSGTARVAEPEQEETAAQVTPAPETAAKESSAKKAEAKKSTKPKPTAKSGGGAGKAKPGAKGSS